MPNMFDSPEFYPHSFSLVRNFSDKLIEGIKGQYIAEKKQVLINGLSLNIAVGDTLIQHLPGGQNKKLVVTDVVPYDDAILGQWYELNVELAHELPQSLGASYTVNNFGSVGQIGQGNEATFVNHLAESSVFEDIRKTLLEHKKLICNLSEVLKALSELENEKDRASASYKLKFARFVEVAANTMTVIAPFLPRLM